MQTLQRRCSGSLYRVLGVERTAATAEIKKAYHREALRCHPDKVGGSTEEFKKVQEAHAILSDDQQRKLYDTFGREGLKHIGDSEVGAAMASTMANNPMLMRFAGFILFLASVLMLIFQSLVVVKIDQRKSWTWAVVFTPIWMFVAVFSLFYVVQIVQTIRERLPENIPGILSGGLAIASVICLSLGLDGHLNWHRAFVPMFLLLAFLTFQGFIGLRPSNYERLLRLSQVENFAERPGYGRFLAVGLFEMCCTWTTAVLLYLRITDAGFSDTSFWLVFLPAILRTCMPAVVGVLTVICCNPQGEEATWKDKVLHVFGILFSSAMGAFTVLMITTKCEQDYNTHHPKTHISAGVCCILLFFANAMAILASCGACCMGGAQDDGGLDYGAADGGESGIPPPQPGTARDDTAGISAESAAAYINAAAAGVSGGSPPSARVAAAPVPEGSPLLSNHEID